MDMLKKLFPFSFGAKDITNLVIKCIILLVLGVVIGIVIGIVAKIPLIGWIVVLLGGLVDLYVLISIILAILDYLKILK